MNLFFQVLGKRGNYHEIASMYSTVSVGDFLVFSEKGHDSLSTSDPSLTVDSSNLVQKALDLFRSFFPNTPYFHIHIQKNIPQKAGLGGASSNAATTLWALNHWLGYPLEVEELMRLGATIGSDVPFFFSNGLAYCTGRGDVVETQNRIFPFEGYIASPLFSLSTPLVYSRFSLNHVSKKPLLPEDFFARPTYFNDLEKAAASLNPEIIHFKKALLDAGFLHVAMSGSGSSFFCLGEIQKNRKLPGVLYKMRELTRTKESWYSL